MSLRFVCLEKDVGAAAHVGGPVDMKWVTFTDVVELEAWLRVQPTAYCTRTVQGVEVIDVEGGENG